MSTILKRFEIWILVVLVIAGVWWALDQETITETAAVTPGETNGTSSPTEALEKIEESILEVRNVNLVKNPDGSGSLLELTLFGRSGTDATVTLGDENVEVLTSEGEGIDRFFVPFDIDPVLPADEKTLVTLKYWLKKEVDVLWLTYRDQTLKVELLPSSDTMANL